MTDFDDPVTTDAARSSQDEQGAAVESKGHRTATIR